MSTKHNTKHNRSKGGYARRLLKRGVTNTQVAQQQRDMDNPATRARKAGK